MPATATSPADELLTRLAEPETSQALHRLLDQLPLLAFSAEALSNLVSRSDALAEHVGRQVAEMRQGGAFDSVQELGTALPGLMKASTHLAEMANRPAFENLVAPELIDELGRKDRLALIKRLLDRLDLIVFALDSIEAFLRRSDCLVENLRDGVRDAVKAASSEVTLAHLQSLLAVAPQLLEAVSQLVNSGIVGKTELLAQTGERLVRSGLLDTDKMQMVFDVGDTLSESMDAARVGLAKGRSTPKLGLLGLLGELKDPDIQASLSLFLDFSRRYGKRLRQNGHA